MNQNANQSVIDAIRELNKKQNELADLKQTVNVLAAKEIGDTFFTVWNDTVIFKCVDVSANNVLFSFEVYDRYSGYDEEVVINIPIRVLKELDTNPDAIQKYNDECIKEREEREKAAREAARAEINRNEVEKAMDVLKRNGYTGIYKDHV